MEFVLIVYLMQLLLLVVLTLFNPQGYIDIRNKVIDEAISKYPEPRENYQGIWFDIVLAMIFSLPIIGLIIYNNYIKC